MPSLTKTDAAFEELRRAIYSGKLRPGQRLKVTDLQAMLEMSPTPIREALRLLQAAGLVEHQSHRGMIVSKSSAAQDEERYELRAILEPLAVEKAAKKARPEQVEKIVQHYVQLRTLTDRPTRTRGALDRITQTHAALFGAIFSASNSKILIEFIKHLRSSIRQPMHQWEETLDDQGAIVKAIRERDVPRARKAMTAYLSHVHELSAALAAKMSQDTSEN